MRILKYTLEITDEQTIEMHECSLILDVQLQYGEITLWVIADDSRPKEERKFMIYETGHEINQGDAYVGTVQTQNVKAVWHIFESYHHILKADD